MGKCKTKSMLSKMELFWRSLIITFMLLFSAAVFIVFSIQVDNTCRTVGFGRENKYNFYIENDGEHVSVAIFDKIYTFDISNEEEGS